MERLLAALTLVPLTCDAARQSGRIRGPLRRTGRQMEAVDGHLAACAHLGGFVLLTDDTDFAPLDSELLIENWLL